MMLDLPVADASVRKFRGAALIRILLAYPQPRVFYFYNYNPQCLLFQTTRCEKISAKKCLIRVKRRVQSQPSASTPLLTVFRPQDKYADTARPSIERRMLQLWQNISLDVQDTYNRDLRPFSLRQTIIGTTRDTPIIRLPEERFKALQKKATYAVFCGAKPFSLYEEDEMDDFLTDLQPAFKAPSAYVIGGRLLDECYEETYKEVLTVIRGNPEGINVSTDESATATKERVINFSILCKLGSFCMKQDAVPKGKFGAEEQADWLELQLDELETRFKAEFGQDAQLPPINSVSTDTCSTMRSMWIRLRSKPRFQRTFFIPCDSHGLQLLIKDIITLDLFKDTMATCNQIVAHFRLAQKQLALLRHYQREIYGKPRALTLAGNTRWGSQIGELRSLKRSMDALKRWARDLQNECENEEILQALLDILYWNDVDELLQILEPLHEAQVMSESSKGNLSHVYSRWEKLEAHLSLQDESTDLLSTYAERFEKQTSEIHLMAFHLNPANQAASYKNPGELNKLMTFLKDHQDPEEHMQTRLQFLHYKSRRQEFAAEELWEEQWVANPMDFWTYAYTAGPELAVFAQRLLSTPPNSLPCERAFSCMKLHQNRLRTNLSLARLDKLCFIHMNRRTLKRKPSDLKRTLHSLNEDEEMAAEIDLAAVEVVEQHTIILEGEEVTEETERYTLDVRKRHRRDLLPTETIARTGESQGAFRPAKRGRR